MMSTGLRSIAQQFAVRSSAATLGKGGALDQLASKVFKANDGQSVRGLWHLVNPSLGGSQGNDSGTLGSNYTAMNAPMSGQRVALSHCSNGQCTKACRLKHDGSFASAAKEKVSNESPTPETKLKNAMLGDGLPLIIHRAQSHGATLVASALDGTSSEPQEYINFHGGYGSDALGMNYPGITQQAREQIADAAIDKLAHADIYTDEFLEAIDTISERFMKPEFKKMFLVDGGNGAVENGIKTAIRNKVLQNCAAGRSAELGKTIVGAEGAFHGRGGYTMSLSRSNPAKHEFMPKFDWPAFNPPLEDTPEAIKASLDEIVKIVSAKPHDVAAVVIEMTQCEGGDRHIPVGFFEGLQQLAAQYEFLVIYDEVQTGFYSTGEKFAFLATDIPSPDILVGAKKSSVGYVFVNDRVLETPGNAFEKSGKINSTWGGHGADTLMFAEKIKLIQQDGLAENTRERGEQLLASISDLAGVYPDLVQNPRGLGLICAFDCPTQEKQEALIERAQEKGVLLLSGGMPDTGPFTVRMRPPLTVSSEEISEGVNRLDEALKSLAQEID